MSLNTPLSEKSTIIIMSLLKDKHIQYIKTLDDHEDSLAYWLTEHLRLSE